LAQQLFWRCNHGGAVNLTAQLFRRRNYAVRSKRIAALIAETNINASKCSNRASIDDKKMSLIME
jgi:hypothetical protein